jgi:hypothetical protein
VLREDLVTVYFDALRCDDQTARPAVVAPSIAQAKTACNFVIEESFKSEMNNSDKQ